MQLGRFYRFEVFIRSQVHHHIIALLLQGLIQFCGDPIAPEAVQVFALRVLQLDPHLQPVRHHQVQRAQHPVQTREHPQMLLCEVEILFAEVLRL
ncbi:hypothetical protein D3C76_1430730 [compost metagenome]